MSRKRRDKPQHRGGLTAEDLAVWDHVAKGIKRSARGSKDAVQNHDTEAHAPRETSIEALERVFTERLKAAQGSAEDRAVGRVAVTSRDAGRTGEVKPARPSSKLPPTKQASALEPEPRDLDHKLSRRIRRGQIEIDARLDLHGMTQARAHSELRGFLLRCSAQKLRTVLVITGKGRRDETDKHHDWWQDKDGEGRGILRRNLPGWLADPTLKPLVLGYEAAAQRHGGSGAFYVRLRRRS